MVNVKIVRSVTVDMLRIPLHLGTLNDFTSHLTRPIVSKGMEKFQEVKHRQELSLVNTHFIDHNIITQSLQHHEYIIITMSFNIMSHQAICQYHYFSPFHLCNKLK